METLSFLRCVFRGALAGIVFGLLFNYQRWYCLRPKLDLEELYETREPNIPEEYLRNLSIHSPPISGDRKFILHPWRLSKHLESDLNAKYFMIFLVAVGPADAKFRFLARLSWASVGEIEGKRIGVVFLVPAGVNDGQDKLLAAENDLYGDILQTNLDYRTKEFESLRILSGYQWCVENIGRRSEFFVNIDSNAFPFLPNLYEYTLNPAKDPNFNFAIHCGSKLVGPLRKPRDPSSKYYVKRKIYNESFFPSHCQESVVLIAQSTLKDLYDIALLTKIGPIPQGDVYVWGILREKLRAEGVKNIVDAQESIIKDDLMPLWHRVEFHTSKAAKDVEILWGKTKSYFMFSTDDHGDAKKRRASLIEIPTSDSKKTPQNDMKTFVYKWGRISSVRRKTTVS